MACSTNVHVEEFNVYSGVWCYRFVLSNRKKINLDINAADKDGWSALLYAVSAKNHEFVRMLILEGRIFVKKKWEIRDHLEKLFWHLQLASKILILDELIHVLI